jgi:hypothetical protein
MEGDAGLEPIATRAGEFADQGGLKKVEFCGIAV